MKKFLLSLAAAFLSVASAMGGTTSPIAVGYDIGTVTDENALSKFELVVTYEPASALTLDMTKKISIVSGDGATFESSRISWSYGDAATVYFSPTVTFAGTYTVFIPEGLFVTAGGTKASQSWFIQSAFTIGNPPPAPKKDFINIANMNASLPIGGKLEIKDPDDYTQVGRSGSLTGASGAKYAFKDVMISNQNETEFTFGMGGQIYNTTAADGYIQAIEGCSGAYFSNEPITETNYWQADYAFTDDRENPVLPDGPAKYFFIPCSALDSFYELTIEWGDEPVVGTVKTPVINKSNWNDTRSGTIVTASTYTNGATVSMNVKSSNGVDTTVTGQAGSSEVTYTITGEEGTVWNITAWAVKEGYNDSETASETYIIDIPTLSEPYIEYPSEEWGAKMPVNGLVTISNQNYEGTIYYSVNGGETQSSEEMSVTLRAVGQIGEPYELEAWIEAPGFNPSPKASIGVYLIDNHLQAPTFSPDGGSVIAGSPVTINADDNTLSIVYRINGGEWISEDYYSWNPVQITITEDSLVEAYASAGDPEYSSYADSEIVGTSFVVEKLSENEVFIDKVMLGIGMFPDNYTASGVYGDYEYCGWTYGSTINLVDDYYDADEVEYNEWFRNTTATEEIIAIRANMASGAVAAFFANDKIELNVELFNNDRDDYALLGKTEEGRVSAANNEWLELEDTKFAGNKFFFIRGYGNEAEAQSFMLRYGKPNAIRTVEGLTESDARYFTLDGIEVDARHPLAPGLYIRVLGTTTEKLIVR